MINVVNRFLEGCDFIRVGMAIDKEHSDFYLYKPKDQRREEYYITLQICTQITSVSDFLELHCQSIHDHILKSNKVERFFDKNSTLLICADESLIDRKSILEIEEDPYNFKKNVICYSSEELESFNDRVSKNINTFNSETISQIINEDDGNKFIEFKTFRKNDYYSLAMKVIQKIPSLTYNCNAQELGNLLNEFELDLDKELKQKYDDLIGINFNLLQEDLFANLSKIWGEK